MKNVKKYLIEVVYQYIFGGLFIALIVGYPLCQESAHPNMDTETYMWLLGILMFAWVTIILNVVKDLTLNV